MTPKIWVGPSSTNLSIVYDYENEISSKKTRFNFSRRAIVS